MKKVLFSVVICIGSVFFILKTAAVPAAAAKTDMSDIAAMGMIDIDRADIDKVNIDRANIGRTDIDKVNIDRTDINRANIDRTDIDRADIGRTDVNRADINITDIDITEIDFTDLDLTNIGITGIGRIGIGVTNEVNNITSIIQPVGADAFFKSELTADEYRKAAMQAEGATFGYTDLGISNVEENNLNIRALADESGRLVGKLPKNAACEVIGEENGWHYIKSGEVEGYVKAEFLLTGFRAVKKAGELASTVAVVTTDSLKVREEPNTDCEVITLVPRGEVLDVAAVREDGWVEIYLDDEAAFVSAEFVEVKDDLAKAITMTELLYGEGVSDVRVDLCQYAKQFLGNPYVWGGTSLTKGADCSGFVLSIFKKYGVALPHSSSAQSGYGTKVSAATMQAGDLVFYARGGRIDHVAIYIGGGQVIHASSKKTGIKISAYNYRTPAKIVKVLYD